MRDRLLDAALGRFAADGVGATSLDAVRRDAKASVGSLYHAFPAGKTELVAALYVRTLAGYQDAFTQRLARSRAARAGIRATVRLHVDWHLADPDAARFLHATREPELRAAVGAPLRERNAAFFAAIRAWIAPHVAAGTLRDLPFVVRYALWLGPAQELCRQWLSGVARLDAPTTRLLADAAWTALRTHPDEGDA